MKKMEIFMIVCGIILVLILMFFFLNDVSNDIEQRNADFHEAVQQSCSAVGGKFIRTRSTVTSYDIYCYKDGEVIII